jgi:hypothetical protein
MLFICNEFAVLIPCLVQFKDRRQNKTKQFGKSEWEVLTQATERVLVSFLYSLLFRRILLP